MSPQMLSPAPALAPPLGFVQSSVDHGSHDWKPFRMTSGLGATARPVVPENVDQRDRMVVPEAAVTCPFNPKRGQQQHQLRELRRKHSSLPASLIPTPIVAVPPERFMDQLLPEQQQQQPLPQLRPLGSVFVPVSESFRKHDGSGGRCLQTNIIKTAATKTTATNHQSKPRDDEDDGDIDDGVESLPSGTRDGHNHRDKFTSAAVVVAGNTTTTPFAATLTNNMDKDSSTYKDVDANDVEKDAKHIVSLFEHYFPMNTDAATSETGPALTTGNNDDTITATTVQEMTKNHVEQRKISFATIATDACANKKTGINTNDLEEVQTLDMCNHDQIRDQQYSVVDAKDSKMNASNNETKNIMHTANPKKKRKLSSLEPTRL